MSSNRTNGTKPAIQHTKSILDDRRIRLLLAIVGAIVAWMVVTIVVQPGTTRTINNVPVDFTYDSAAYTSRGLSIVSAPEKYVSLKLSGDGYTIGSLTSSDFVVYPDWSGVRDSGEKTLHLQVRGVNTLLNGVSVSIEGGDNSVDVVFDVVEEKTVPITVTTNYLTIADGYILYGTELSKETVTLSGPSTEIDKVETCTAEVTHKGELTDSVTLDTALRFYTKSGSEVKFEYTNLEESSVEVTLEVYKMATLPVSVSFINAPRNFDPSVLVYSLSKQTLNIAGPESQIEKLSTLSVGTIDLSTFALNKVYELPIELPGNIRLLDNISSITVSFDSSKLETKTMNLPASCVQVVNLPSTYTLTVQTERLMNVTLCGPKAALETLTPEQVVVEIDAEDFSEVPPPKFFRLKPEGEVRLMGAYIVKCGEIVKNPDGTVKEIHCTADLETGNGTPADGRKIKGTIHWLSAEYAVDTTLVLYDHLFTLENVADMPEGKTYDDYISPDSAVRIDHAKLEPAAAGARAGEKFQFVRTGYFAVDTKNPNTFNRIVGLKDGYKA